VARHTFHGEARKAGLRRREHFRHMIDILGSGNLKANMFQGSGAVVHYFQNRKQLKVTNVNDGHSP